MRTLILAGTVMAAIVSGLGTSMAAEGTYSAWGHDFTLSQFHETPMQVAVAIERSTGHTMNIVKLKNGHMMTLVPADRYMALMTPASDDMIK